MNVYVRYQDDGPIGMCGQVYSANPWDQLHIFDDEEKANIFMRKSEKYQGRKNARITAIWHDDQEEIYPAVQRHG